ncbi:MAG: NADH-quinone oxidoreductase subunit H [Candidatus Eisenbacteria bacterium]|nr:NADH-quinone oxidoreductase subunit H [Candidatus Eisenbacteria bacterium]
MSALAQLGLLLALAPLTQGVAQRVKSWMAGRRGPALLQPYRDLLRLFRKGAVYSTTATWISQMAPPVIMAATLGAFLFVPLGAPRAPLAFPGDLVLFAYLLALARFALIALAMDAGSSFEGMGASREAWIAAMAEPALFLALGALAVMSGEISLSGLLASGSGASLYGAGLTRALVAVALWLVLLAETSRMPVDDPATHLELTMVHEVMILDVSGPDLALCEYANAVKLYGLSLLLSQVVVPPGAGWGAHLLAQLAGVGACAALVGVTESLTARVAMRRVPQLLIGASVLAGVALVAALGAR